MKKLLTLLVFTAWWAASTAQTDTTGVSNLDAALNATKMLSAEHEFIKGNMRGALTLYREILSTDAMNFKAQLGEAECYYNLKKYADSFHSLDKAVRINGGKTPELTFFYAKCYHRTGDLDRAISEYKAFLKVAKKTSYEAEEAAKFIKECEFAKRKMAQPVDVTITNMGEGINSRLDEYAPSITSDGKTLIYTSRRDNTTSPPDKAGKNIDVKGDYKFFEDIYISHYEAQHGHWSDCENLPGEVNTVFHDGVLSVVPDGSGIYVYKNNTENAGDIYFSKRQDDGTYKAAELLPKTINSSFFESSASQTADGSKLYFISERQGGLGLGDIYVASKVGTGWGKPVNLGEMINTKGDEKFVFIHPNGKTLFFASNGHLGLGSYDIFKSEFVNGVWTKPLNLGYPINTVNEESTFSLTQDNALMYISAEYDDSYGERDIYKIDVSRYPALSAGYETSIYAQLLCVIVDTNGKPFKGVKIAAEDLDTGDVFEATTDKMGYARINVQGNKTYKVTATKDTKTFSEEVTIEMRNGSDTVHKWEIRL